MDIVELGKIQKQIRKTPGFVQIKLFKWVKQIEQLGVKETRKIPGLHDEPLSGKRIGQRSARLSKAWRVIYTESKTGLINIIRVEEVTKHDY